MPTVSFAKVASTPVEPTPPAAAPAPKVEPAPVVPQETAAPQLPATVASAPLAQRPEVPPVSGLEGDFQASDIKLPRINLVQKTSEAVDAGFRPGDILFKSGEVLLPLALPAFVTVIALRKQYQENLPYGGSETPRVFDTAAEVREAGGSLEWGSECHFKEMAHVQLLFEAPADTPADLLDLFPYEYDGKAYAMGMFTLAGSAYTNGAKPIITAMLSHLRGKHWTGRWQLTSEVRKDARNSWHVPIFKMAGRHDEAFAAFARQFLP